MSTFPFRHLKQDTYSLLDVLMYIDYNDALKFMYTVNKEARSFIQNNYITMRNEFDNNGLIEHEFIFNPDSEFEIFGRFE